MSFGVWSGSFLLGLSSSSPLSHSNWLNKISTYHLKHTLCNFSIVYSHLAVFSSSEIPSWFLQCNFFIVTSRASRVCKPRRKALRNYQPSFLSKCPIWAATKLLVFQLSRRQFLRCYGTLFHFAKLNQQWRKEKKGSFCLGKTKKHKAILLGRGYIWESGNSKKHLLLKLWTVQ